MKQIAGSRLHLSIRIGYAFVVACFAAVRVSAVQLSPANWVIYNYSGASVSTLTNGTPLPPTGFHMMSSGNTSHISQTIGQTTNSPVTNLTMLSDNNLSTFVTLSSPQVLLIDLGQTCVIDRVYLIGSTNQLNLWNNYQQNYAVPPLGVIAAYVGNTPTTTNLAAQWAVPYDAGSPIETEADLKFSPASGRFLRIEMQQAPSSPGWNVGEMEIYGFSGSQALQTNVNAVVLPTGAPAPLALAASDLSYYLGELTGLPHPIIPPQSTNQFSGTLYQIQDLASLAPDYQTMMANISNGTLPTNVSATISGRTVTFSSWPYRTVLWSVWEFLERQGVRWVYPDSHGDLIPTGAGVNLSTLPFTYYPPTVDIYMNFDYNTMAPWFCGQFGSLRPGLLYFWRNRWTFSQQGYGPLGGSEIPTMPNPYITVNSNYVEGFVGYPHNFNNAVPPRIADLPANTNWWGWATTNAGSQVDPSTEAWPQNSPVVAMDNPSLISWLAQKMTNIAAAQPLACSYPLNICHKLRPFGILPIDASVYSQDPYTIASNGPVVPDPVPWVKEYSYSYSGMYYSMITAVANQAAALSPNSVPLVGALAYADVFLPPTNVAALTVFPTNVQVEVCLYGSPNTLMNSPANSGFSNALVTWSTVCSHLASYDYSLLHTDWAQTDPRLPVPLVAGLVDKARFLAKVGALDGGTQASLTSLPYNPWNFYAYPRCRWNTNLSASQLEQEFFSGYFQEASAPMLAYYQAMENYQVSNGVSMYYTGYCYNITPGSFPINILAQMQTNLAAAQSLATNWFVQQRVANVAAGFGWIITNTPDNLIGVNLSSSISNYPKLDPEPGPVSLDLSAMIKPHKQSRRKQCLLARLADTDGLVVWWRRTNPKNL